MLAYACEKCMERWIRVCRSAWLLLLLNHWEYYSGMNTNGYGARRVFISSFKIERCAHCSVLVCLWENSLNSLDLSITRTKLQRKQWRMIALVRFSCISSWCSVRFFSLSVCVCVWWQYVWKPPPTPLPHTHFSVIVNKLSSFTIHNRTLHRPCSHKPTKTAKAKPAIHPATIPNCYLSAIAGCALSSSIEGKYRQKNNGITWKY